jgi:hypothetical protein
MRCSAREVIRYGGKESWTAEMIRLSSLGLCITRSVGPDTQQRATAVRKGLAGSGSTRKAGLWSCIGIPLRNPSAVLRTSERRG